MRILLTSLAVPSHLWTMVVPTARLLQSAGHDVAIATGTALADEIARTGVPVLPLERMLDHAQLAAEPELAAQAGYGGSGNLADQPDASHGAKLGQFVAGILAERAAEELLTATATWRPDLVEVTRDAGILPCTAIVALGDDAAETSWSGPRPANVHLTGFAAQRALLPACDLFVTHAGFGSLREALAAGIPMVALPLHSEQPANAQRLAELEFGITLDPMEATTEGIAEARRTVLTEPGYRARAQQWRRRTLDMPDSTAMVRDLEDLAAK